MQCNTIINVCAHFLTVQAWYGYRNTSWCGWVGDWVGDFYLLLLLLLRLIDNYVYFTFMYMYMCSNYTSMEQI